jgi:hypothetical protein
MKPSKIPGRVLCVAMITILAIAASAQSDKGKQYDKNGISFEYGEGWMVLTDRSSADSQELGLADPETDAQILIIVTKRRVESKDPMTDLRKQSVDPWLNRMVQGYENNGIKVQREAAASEIAGQPVEGARLAFELDGQKGIGEAFWTVLDKRLVLTYFLRPERTAKKAMVGWDLIRKTLKLEPAKVKLEPINH